jgi:peptidyl-prolyl cis-trans isomerase A (cyclophilin A)
VPASAAATAPVAARENGTYARISITQGGTPVGDIVFKFLDTEAPLTSKNFIDLAEGRKVFTDPKTDKKVRRRFYDGLTFHRVIPQFMIQGGDPLGNGTGSVDVVPDEFKNGLIFDRPGRVAMAHAGPGTASCQFFITEAPRHQLDGDYTIFGQVVEGQDFVGIIARTPRDEDDRPNRTVRIAKVTIERVGVPAPTVSARPVAKKSAAAVKAAPAKK